MTAATYYSSPSFSPAEPTVPVIIVSKRRSLFARLVALLLVVFSTRYLYLTCRAVFEFYCAEPCSLDSDPSWSLRATGFPSESSSFAPDVADVDDIYMREPVATGCDGSAADASLTRPTAEESTQQSQKRRVDSVLSRAARRITALPWMKILTAVMAVGLLVTILLPAFQPHIYDPLAAGVRQLGDEIVYAYHYVANAISSYDWAKLWQGIVSFAHQVGHEIVYFFTVQIPHFFTVTLPGFFSSGSGAASQTANGLPQKVVDPHGSLFPGLV